MLFEHTVLIPDAPWRGLSPVRLSLPPPRLIELCPDDPSGYSNRGYAFRKLGDYEAAVDDYSTAISLSGSSSTRLHNNRAYCLAKLGRYQEAIADYDAVVAMDPDNVHAYHNRCVRPAV